MKRSLFFLLSLLLLFVVGCADRKEQMLAQLAELERQNIADSLMTNDSLAKALVTYFDDHGTPNERLRARYILGRTYADLGEAPAALDAYLDAAACSDTTTADCDWGKLSRVYGQMAGIFYDQNLINENFNCISLSVYYGQKAKDTLEVLNEEILRATAYDLLGKYDSAIIVFDSAIGQINRIYGVGQAASYSILPIRGLLKTGKFEEAKKNLYLYETKSGYVNPNGDVEEGCEVYYYQKGMYYYCTQQYDSAEYYFKKGLLSSPDCENQSMTSRGLSLVYQQINRLDSATKYALYSYEMNDSAYAEKVTREMERTIAQHNYTRHQKIAHQEREKAEHERMVKERLIVLLFVILVIIWGVTMQWRRIRRRERHKFRIKAAEWIRTKEKLQEIQALHESEMQIIKENELTISEHKLEVEKLHRHMEDLDKHIKEKETKIGLQEAEMNMLRSQEAEFKKLSERWQTEIEKKEKDIFALREHTSQLECQMEVITARAESLQNDISEYHRKELMVKKNAEGLLAESSTYQQLLYKTNKCELLAEEDWTEIDAMVKDTLPGFYDFLSSKKTDLGKYGYQICLLLRLHMRMKYAAGFIGISKSQVSNICSEIMINIFQERGSGKDLKQKLEAIS